jgi:hypothetical protein
MKINLAKYSVNEDMCYSGRGQFLAKGLLDDHRVDGSTGTNE